MNRSPFLRRLASPAIVAAVLLAVSLTASAQPPLPAPPAPVPVPVPATPTPIPVPTPAPVPAPAPVPSSSDLLPPPKMPTVPPTVAPPTVTPVPVAPPTVTLEANLPTLPPGATLPAELEVTFTRDKGWNVTVEKEIMVTRKSADKTVEEPAIAIELIGNMLPSPALRDATTASVTKKLKLSSFDKNLSMTDTDGTVTYRVKRTGAGYVKVKGAAGGELKGSRIVANGGQMWLVSASLAPTSDAGAKGLTTGFVPFELPAKEAQATTFLSKSPYTGYTGSSTVMKTEGKMTIDEAKLGTPGYVPFWTTPNFKLPPTFTVKVEGKNNWVRCQPKNLTQEVDGVVETVAGVWIQMSFEPADDFTGQEFTMEIPANTWMPTTFVTKEGKLLVRVIRGGAGFIPVDASSKFEVTRNVAFGGSMYEVTAKAASTSSGLITHAMPVTVCIPYELPGRLHDSCTTNELRPYGSVSATTTRK